MKGRKNIVHIRFCVPLPNGGMEALASMQVFAVVFAEDQNDGYKENSSGSS